LRCSAPPGTAIGIASTYTQIGLVLLLPCRERDSDRQWRWSCARRPAHQDAAVEAARKRFRPIIMTSFAFILGVVPLVLAKGGAAARASIGIAFSGMLPRPVWRCCSCPPSSSSCNGGRSVTKAYGC
jgi:HAE1 family hydrophobic/amphiphilic exporter-1